MLVSARAKPTFWERVEKTQTCWLWKGPFNQNGYGNVSGTGAHRLSWEKSKGPIPEGLCVLHRCDTPACVNPEHLFLGTRADNVKDMLDKGRWQPNYGCVNGRWKHGKRAMPQKLQLLDADAELSSI